MPEYGRQRQKVDLPTRAFLYTTDQIATLVSMTEEYLFQKYLFCEGRDYGRRDAKVMVARNIASVEKEADWRVSEDEFIRWCRAMGFHFYARRIVG